MPDARLFAQDPVRRWSEAPAPAGWRELRPEAARSRTRLSLRAAPDTLAAQVTEALPGEDMEILAAEGEWLWGRTVHDGYLGWLPREGVADGAWSPDLWVTARRAHAYAGPRVSAPVVAELCWGSGLRRAAGEVVTTGPTVRSGDAAAPAASSLPASAASASASSIRAASRGTRGRS